MSNDGDSMDQNQLTKEAMTILIDGQQAIGNAAREFNARAKLLENENKELMRLLTGLSRRSLILTMIPIVNERRREVLPFYLDYRNAVIAMRQAQFLHCNKEIALYEGWIKEEIEELKELSIPIEDNEVIQGWRKAIRSQREQQEEFRQEIILEQTHNPPPLIERNWTDEIIIENIEQHRRWIQLREPTDTE